MHSRHRRAIAIAAFLLTAPLLLELAPEGPLLRLPTIGAQTPPDGVAYYGEHYGGDEFVWCLDRSCSMAWGHPAPGATMKSAVVSALHTLSASQEFSLLAFDITSTVFSPAPVPATAANIAAAEAWVNALPLGENGGTCALTALLDALAILQNTDGAILFTTDGEPNCPGPQATLDGVLAANTGQNPIHAFNLGDSASADSFLQALAAQNFGTYLDTIGIPPNSPFVRGDGNVDGQFDIADVIYTLGILFPPPSQPANVPWCADANDANDDGHLDIADPIAAIGALFPPPGAGAPLPPPFIGCGDDPTDLDPLGCSLFPPCP